MNTPFLNVLLLIFAFGICGCVSATKEDKPAESGNVQKPNIVILLADDLGWNDVGYHNSKMRTPHIDAFARESVMLERFYVSNVCSPSRGALLTGKYPGRLGLNNGVITPESKFGLPPEVNTLPELLQHAGYKQRACIGKWHLGHSDVKYHPLQNGFTYFYGHYGGMVDYFLHKRRGQLDWHRNYETCRDEGYATDLIAKEAVNFISNASDEFFLYVPFNAPHSPLQAEEENLKYYGYDQNLGFFTDDGGLKKGEIERPNQRGRGNTPRQTYKAMVTSMDDAIGEILAAIDAKGIKDNTIVFFLSDNGAITRYGGSNLPLKGEKGGVHEGGVRVPAVIRWPQMLEGGRTLRSMMGHVDLVPTLQDLLKLPEQHGGTDGINILPQLMDSEKNSGDRHFYLGREAIATEEWKWVKDQLFDIQKDMREYRDLSRQHPEIAKDLQEKLTKMRSEIEISVKPDRSYRLLDNWLMPGTEQVKPKKDKSQPVS